MMWPSPLLYRDAFMRLHIAADTNKVAGEPKTTAASGRITKALPKKSPVESKKTTGATKNKTAPKKAASKSTTTSTSATVKRGTKRKLEDDAPAPPAKKPSGKKVTTTDTKSAAAEKALAKTTTKRRAADGEAVPSAKKSKAPAKQPKARVASVEKTKTVKKAAVINEPPSQRVNVYVFGEGTAGELGLGTAKNAVDVKRPRLNPFLAADKVGVVQIVAGGMHAIALTHDNKVLTWGVNDQGALGRDTTWDGGLKDMDAGEEDSDDDDDNDNGLSPRESIPAEVDFSGITIPEGTRFTQVAAGDSCSFVLTDDGFVYGWGTFRGNEGILGFDPKTEQARRPVLIPDLKKITKITAGANHVLALDTNGSVFAWGSGQQNQLGRRIVERTKHEGLKPREFGLPKGPKKGIVDIETGSYHSFAIDRAGNVFSWGLNNFGETGIPENAGADDALIMKPQIVEAFKGKKVVSIKGGSHHSLCALDNGDCLIWGRMDSAQIGISDEEIAKLGEDVVVKDHSGPRMMLKPTKVSAIEGKVVYVTASSDHNVVITKEGKAWSWGFSGNYQTGQGQIEDVTVARMIDNTAVREQKLNYATVGGQFGIVTAPA
jgi:regulator of chromosome condensation